MSPGTFAGETYGETRNGSVTRRPGRAEVPP